MANSILQYRPSIQFNFVDRPVAKNIFTLKSYMECVYIIVIEKITSHYNIRRKVGHKTKQINKNQTNRQRGKKQGKLKIKETKTTGDKS